MEVRAALKKSTWSQEVMIKSPSAILKPVTKLGQQIKGMSEAPPVNQPVDLSSAPAGEEMETNESDDTSTEDELLEATDVDEESVNISASSITSEKDSGKMNVTREDGKLDLEKIRSWSIPKLNKSVLEREGIADQRRKSQRARRKLTVTSTQVEQPQAASTPHPKKINRSLTLQAVQSKLRPSKIQKTDT